MPSFVDRAVRWLQGKNAVVDDVYVFIKYDTDDIFLVKAKVMSFAEKTLKVEITCRDIVNAIHAGKSQKQLFLFGFAGDGISAYLNDNPNVRQEFTYRNIILHNDHYTTEVKGEPLFVGFPSETNAIAAAKVPNPSIQAKNISKTIDKLKIAAHTWQQKKKEQMEEQMEERQRARRRTTHKQSPESIYVPVEDATKWVNEPGWLDDYYDKWD